MKTRCPDQSCLTCRYLQRSRMWCLVRAAVVAAFGWCSWFVRVTETEGEEKP